ncbi:hypothetical protein VTJ83DRAFT_2323 [Remersonia thermophila]|uniref:CAP-Gly domain-containing protein n=1 Tax=Remersonia thermophila TaxID=72144 RepID=A0ABR4DJD7_9PEZI
MSLTTTTPTPASTSAYNTTTRHTLSRRPLRGGAATASTPNLGQLYAAQQRHTLSPSPSRLAPPALSRKGSVAALTQNSLAAIPDDSHAYAYNSVLNSSNTDEMPPMPPPHTPGRFAAAAHAADDIAIGDTVEVPGSMMGTVRFIGPVTGRKGTFAGVELHPEFAARGKNNGDVDGVYYFTTVQPGAGIFLPLSKAIKREAPPIPGNPYPMTPASGGLRVASQNATNFTSPPTPGVPKLSQSLGPTPRASSPLGKKVRPSLQRPESPVRRFMTPGPPSRLATPAPRSTGQPPRLASPTSANKLTQSVRSSAGDPSKRAPPGGGHTRKPSVGPRSVSVLGISTHHNMVDDDVAPLGVQRTQTNGSMGSSVSSFALKVRPASRAMSRTGNHAADEEVERLRAELEDRDRQLKEQAQTLAEMESSLNELQGLIESSEGPPAQQQRRDSLGDKDTAQLRALVREKNEKIAMLTAEFDAHRADFRSTIDTLEMASSETERVYEKRIEELMMEIQELQERTADVDTVAAQLKQLEELVQELEEGLEDARRGEAEARGEVEFLRGEVERTRAELRREKEKAQAALANAAGGGANVSKELEQKEDEIRGLKAIIHSLSAGAGGSSSNNSSGDADIISPDRTPVLPSESIEDRLARERLENEVAELRALLESKMAREEELEREIEMLRRGSVVTAVGPNHRASGVTIGSGAGNEQRSSIRDSRGSKATLTSPTAPATATVPRWRPRRSALAAPPPRSTPRPRATPTAPPRRIRPCGARSARPRATTSCRAPTSLARTSRRKPSRRHRRRARATRTAALPSRHPTTTPRSTRSASSRRRCRPSSLPAGPRRPRCPPRAPPRRQRPRRPRPRRPRRCGRCRASRTRARWRARRAAWWSRTSGARCARGTGTGAWIAPLRTRSERGRVPGVEDGGGGRGWCFLGRVKKEGEVWDGRLDDSFNFFSIFACFVLFPSPPSHTHTHITSHIHTYTHTHHVRTVSMTAGLLSLSFLSLSLSPSLSHLGTSVPKVPSSRPVSPRYHV